MIEPSDFAPVPSASELTPAASDAVPLTVPPVDVSAPVVADASSVAAGMPFEQAFPLMCAGTKMRRAAWSESDFMVFITARDGLGNQTNLMARPISEMIYADHHASDWVIVT